MSNYLYILKGKKVVQAKDLNEWVTWTAKNKTKRVALTKKGNITISTVFLLVSLPVYRNDKWEERHFETMVFKNGSTEHKLLGKTWEEAEKNHKEATKKYL